MFFRTMKKIGILFMLALILGACGPYQEALKGDAIKPKYDLALQYYKEGLQNGKKARLRRVLRLLEQILPQYRGKAQGEKLTFMYANTFYHLEDYYNASYQFQQFIKEYPKSKKVEEAAFKSAKGHYYNSPRYSLDQTETHKAIDMLQNYITRYPAGKHVGEANQIIAALRVKLEKKSFEIARLYYVQEDWKAAVASMENFINENPGSPFMERAYYYRMKAEHTLAVNSFRDVMKERLEKTENYADAYIKYFPKGKYIDDAKTINEDVTQRLKDF